MACIDQFERAMKAAYRHLAYRSRTEQEIRQKLYTKGFDMETVDRVIDNLRDNKMIDDRAFAEDFASRARGDSRASIYGKLRKLGIREPIINSVLEGVDSEAEFRIALSLALNRQKRRGEDYPLEKIAAFLSRRGFSREIIEKVSDYLESTAKP